MYGILQSAGEIKNEMKRNAAKPMQLYIVFEKSNNSCVFIDFWALYWTETAARDGKHEDVVHLTSFLVKNDPCVGLFAKKSTHYNCFYWLGELMRLKRSFHISK